MTIPVRVSDKDLLDLFELVTAYRDEDPGDGLPLPMLRHLMDQVPCDNVSFFGLDTARRATWFGQDAGESGGDDDEDAFWAHYWDCLPCSYPDRSQDFRSVTMSSDFYSARQWRDTGMYREYLRPAGFEHELMLCLPAGPARTVRLMFFRGSGREFSERDRALLALLRPHLREAYEEGQLRRSGAELTARQRDMLRLVAAGHTNAQIGRRLGLRRLHGAEAFRALGTPAA
jgi:hypothetical protein